MAITWGGSDCKVLRGTWKPAITSQIFSDIALLPDPANLNAITSVIQQRGRGRLRCKGKVWAASMTEYLSYVTDYYGGTSKTLVDGDGTNGTYQIESIGEPEYTHDGCIEFDIVFMEV